MDTVLLVAVHVAAIAVAWTLTSRYREHRPIAVLLSMLLGTAVVERVLDVLVLAPLRASLGLAPWTGWAWAAALASHAVGLAWPAAIVGAVLVLFTRQRPWAAAVGWAVAVATYAAVHPLAATGGQARFHAIAEAIGSISAAAIVVAWYRGRPAERATSAQLTLTAIVVADLLTTPAALHVEPLRSLAAPEMLWGTTFAALAVMHGYTLWSRVARCERRQDAADKAVLRSNVFAEKAVAAAQRAEEKAIEARDLADLGAPSGRAP